MKTRKGLLLSVLLVAGLAFVGFSPQSYAAKQKKNLVDESSISCTGATVGKVIVAKKGYSVLVTVKITNGTPNTSRVVFWVCQGGTGCHSECGARPLGVIRTDGSGNGKFKYKGWAPLAGAMHFDICVVEQTRCIGGNYYSGIFAAASDELIEAPEGVIEGDPTLQ